MRMMGELSFRSVKLVHTPGRENPLADLSRMNDDQNGPSSKKYNTNWRLLQPLLALR